MMYDHKSFLGTRPRSPTLADEMIWDALSDEAKHSIARILFLEIMLWVREELEDHIEGMHEFLVHNSEP